MKKSKQCPKCDGLKIGFLKLQADRAQHSSARAVGKNESGIWTGNLEAYVCTECGYFESYVKAPEKLGWNDLMGFRWINPPQQDDPGPYR